MSSLESGLAILGCLTPERPSLRVGETATALRLPKSTVSRLLRVLAAHGLLERDEAQRSYRCGPLALTLGNLYLAQHALIDLVDEALAGLVDRFGVAGYAGVLTGADIVILRVRQGRMPLRVVLDAGQRYPAQITAFGQALLARRTDGEVRALLGRVVPFPGSALRQPVERFLRELALVRKRGWASIGGLVSPGVGAVGTAVGSPAERQAIGFSLSFARSETGREARAAMAEAVADAARRLGLRLGDPHWAQDAAPAAEDGARRRLRAAA